MKATLRLLSMILCLCLLVGLCACGSESLGEETITETETVPVTTTKKPTSNTQSKPFTQEAAGKAFDVIIFGGQSNMQGQTGSFPKDNTPVTGAWEYRYASDYMIPLQHPCGENLQSGLLLAASGNNGSMLPAFCRTYIEETGHDVVAIHVARGSTTINDWLDTPRYELTVDKINKALEKITACGATVRSISYVWLQGESDAIDRMSQTEYEQKLVQLKNNLKEDVGLERFGIVQVGYFNRNRVNAFPDLDEAGRKALDEAIMNAQENVTTYDSDFIMLTKLAASLWGQTQYFNPEVNGHFNNEGQALLGTDAAKTLAKYLKD